MRPDLYDRKLGVLIGIHALWSIQAFLLTFPIIGMRILFLNIDQQGLQEKVDKLKHPDDPVNPV